ncbi:hypothetical protein SAMN05421756_102250 [Microlunatus flavus]|uniref:Mycothiol maleylpyruvate isomerase N-terminal domain-containing protein n=1 Tax=Microlunatus flavus TaxID=1036181 RepID=A0A1H9CL45_9ACTN|nr:hypothetical protein SAMN05421756_102250 [Microlunatus flavus]
MRSGLDEVAAALLGVGSAPRRPDRDAATYWSEPPPGGSDDPVARIVAIRRLGSASRRPVGAVAQLVAVAAALRTGVDRVEDATLGFQGRVLTTGDFLATWAVELAVHQLDLARDLAVPSPPARALALARQTVEALLGDRLPGDDDAGAVLLATGRRAATADELRTLGAGAERLPLL